MILIPPIPPTIIPWLKKAAMVVLKYLPDAIRLYKSGKKEMQELAKIRALNAKTSFEEEMRIGTSLTRIKNEVLDNSYKIQEGIDDFIEEYFDNLKELLEDKNITTSVLDRSYSKCSREIKSVFKSTLNEKISLSNDKWKSALSIENSQNRQESIESLTNEAISCALRSLKNELALNFNETFAIISEKIKDKNDSKLSIIENKIQELEKLKSIQELDKKQLLQIELLSNLSFQNIALKFLEQR